MTHPSKSIAVIGCGYWGKNLVRNMAELGALAAVCDAHAPNAEAQSKLHQVPVKSVDDVMADASITGVVIAAPAAQHAALTTQALNAGKHVFVEKPIALTVADAEAMEKLGAEKKRVVMVGHLLHYHPAYIALKDMVAAGELGAVQYVYSNRLNLGKFRVEENALWSFAPHDISMVLGMFGQAPVSVSAQGMSTLTPGIPDTVTTQFTFASGAKGHVFVSWLHPFKEQKLVVIGDKAMAVFDDSLPLEQKLQLFRHGVKWDGNIPSPVKADGEFIALTASEPLKNECQHFLDAMAGITPARTDAAEGIRVLKVLEAAEMSMKTNGPVSLSPHTVIPVCEATPGSPAEWALPVARDPGVAEANRDDSSNYFAHETAFVDKGCTIGEGTKIWHFTHILGGTTIGKNCVISQNVMIGPDVVVGDRCKIQNNVSLYKGVTLEDGVFCGPSCVFTNVNTPRAEVERKNEYLPTRVGRAATIGANATIVCGNALGEYCLIGAGAVITKPVKPHALMVGNPARQTGWVSHAGEKLGPDLICPREGRKYKIENDHLVEISETGIIAKSA